MKKEQKNDFFDFFMNKKGQGMYKMLLSMVLTFGLLLALLVWVGPGISDAARGVFYAVDDLVGKDEPEDINDCGQFKDDTVCNAKDACEWSKDICIESIICSEFEVERYCEAREEICTWNEEDEKCKDKEIVI